MIPKKIAILGSTGSIGQNAIKVIEQHPEYLQVCALAAGTSHALLAQQAARHPAALLAMADKNSANRLAALLPAPRPGHITWGQAGIAHIIKDSGADMVLNAICGAAGLSSTLATLEAGLDLALANKESLVMAGRLVTALAQSKGCSIIPVDSEHSALWQVWPEKRPEQVRRLWLTASGGPFLDFRLEDMGRITPAMALNHPKWSMGPKISVDSATMMNKGLEVIEAAFLFGRPMEDIGVVIHRQSLVHGLLEMMDGSILAQMGPTDMCLPIALALNFPQRLPASWPTLNILELGNLTFAAPDKKRFPALDLALAAGRAGGTAPAMLNAANEAAVAAFLRQELAFSNIANCVAEVLQQLPAAQADSLEAIMAADAQARRAAEKIAGSLG